MKIVVTADLHADETADMGAADMDRLTSINVGSTYRRKRLEMVEIP